MRIAALLPVAPFVLALACGGAEGPARDQTPPASAPSPAPSRARVLVVTHAAGFRHDSIPAAERTIQAIGEESGLFAVEFCRTAADVQARLTPSGLAGVDAVFFANTTGDLGIPDMRAFLDWIAAGKGFVGAHSASDTYHSSPDYLAMLGAEFLTHGAIVEAEVRVDQPAHPAVAHLAPRFRLTDEWYRFTRRAPGLTILLSFDRPPADGVSTDGPADLPLAWHKPFGAGRVFYTALGHGAEVWEDGRFRTHVREALRFVLGR